jgi:hypothetical protein
VTLGGDLPGDAGYFRRGSHLTQDRAELLPEVLEPADDVIVDDVADEQVHLEPPVVVEDARIVEQVLDGVAERDRPGWLTVHDGVVAGLADRGPELHVLRVIAGQLRFPR